MGKGLWFFLVFIPLSLWHFADHIDKFPAHHHSWTQSDRYAIALKFSSETLNLFKPKTYNLKPENYSGTQSQKMNGVSAMDMPINEYLVGLAMRVLDNRSPIVFRSYMLIVSLLGLFFLYLLPQRYGYGPLHGLALAGIFYISPVYHYYLIGFVPSMAAFSLLIAGTYFLAVHQVSKSKAHFAVSLVLFTLAALMRLPFAINLLALFMAYAFIRLIVKTPKKSEIRGLTFALALIGVYWFYNKYLTSVYGSIFATELMPAISWAEAKYLVKASLTRWGTEYLDWTGYTLLAAMFLSGIFKLGKFRLSTPSFHHLFAVIGFGIFSLLMLTQYPDHDYYAFDSFYPPAILLLAAAYSSVRANAFSKWYLPAGLVIAFTFYSIPRLKNIQEFRYFVKARDYNHLTYKNFKESEQLLDHLHIDKKARVLVIDAFTTNIPLIGLNRDGYTVLTTSKERIVESLQWPYEYVAIQDTFMVSEVVMAYPEIVNQLSLVGGNGKISIYKKQHPQKPEQAMCKLFYLGERNFDSDSIDSTWSATPQLQQSFVKSGYNGAMIDTKAEFGQSLTIKPGKLGLDSLAYHVCVKGFFKMDTVNSKVSVVLVQSRNDSVVQYEQQYFTYKLKGIQALEPVVFNFDIPAITQKEDVLKCYFWKKEAQGFYYDDLKVLIYR